MRFRFIGDPRHGGEGPAVIHFGDVAIGRVDFVEVPPALAEKLSGNWHFESDDSAPQMKVVTEATKDVLIAEAESLGIDVDRRWGVPRLEAEIDKALAKHG